MKFDKRKTLLIIIVVIAFAVLSVIGYFLSKYERQSALQVSKYSFKTTPASVKGILAGSGTGSFWLDPESGSLTNRVSVFISENNPLSPIWPISYEGSKDVARDSYVGSTQSKYGQLRSDGRYYLELNRIPERTDPYNNDYYQSIDLYSLEDGSRNNVVKIKSSRQSIREAVWSIDGKSICARVINNQDVHSPIYSYGSANNNSFAHIDLTNAQVKMIQKIGFTYDEKRLITCTTERFYFLDREANGVGYLIYEQSQDAVQKIAALNSDTLPTLSVHSNGKISWTDKSKEIYLLDLNTRVFDEITVRPPPRPEWFNIEAFNENYAVISAYENEVIPMEKSNDSPVGSVSSGTVAPSVDTVNNQLASQKPHYEIYNFNQKNSLSLNWPDQWIANKFLISPDGSQITAVASYQTENKNALLLFDTNGKLVKESPLEKQYNNIYGWY